MKTIYNYLLGLLLLLVATVACSPELADALDEKKIPLISEMQIEITVDQVTNEVHFNLQNKGNSPIWRFDDGKKSTVNGLTRIYTIAGTYSVEIKSYNRHGISDGSIMREFTVENTLFDFSPYTRRLCGEAGEKQWKFAGAVAGHLGCGPSGSEGTEWFNAKPFEKEAFGIYNNLFTFNAEGVYTFDPGVTGSIYVNAGSTLFPTFNTTGDDFNAPVDVQSSAWKFGAVGTDMYLNFAPQTMLGYIPNDAAFSNPEFRILSLRENTLELVIDNGEIAWHYLFEPVAKVVTKAELLASTTSKTWMWDQNKAGHLGCGPAGSDGLEWFNAAPNEKEEFGVYNHSFTFALDGAYTFNPGVTGTFYANASCTKFPSYNTTGEDFTAPTSIQHATWQIVEEGENTYLIFPAATIVGYVPNDAIYDHPRFRVLSLTASILEMVADNGEIAWHYRFVTDAGEAPEEFEEGEALIPSEYAQGLLASWTWEASTFGHFGCGQFATNPTEWWSAPAFDKEGLGLYDDVMTFKSGGVYEFNPGPDGSIFVNKDFTLAFQESNTNDEEDFTAPASNQTSSYTLTQEGSDYYLNFPAHTILSYIAGNDFYTAPKLKIIRMHENVMELATIQEGISWKFRWKRTN